MKSATTESEKGPKSGTDWVVTSSPPFGILSSTTSPSTPESESDPKSATKKHTIHSYRSPFTSLRGLVVVTDEPICSLHILLSTESNGGGGGGGDSGGTTSHSWHHPDDGLPHTLEHLVFLGSLTHPHKGVLDKLANRCMADGTNAWTATDHTTYTLNTAGSEGAVNLLPIFADHVLFPTLTESGFVTEVHHVNGKGEDKGVVYCEMQGRENSEGSLVDRAVMSLLYPNHQNVSCGYAAETGGKMANLRTLTVDKVRRYHREYYTPDNTIIILTGNVPVEDFFGALDEVEALILRRRKESSEDGKGGEGGGEGEKATGQDAGVSGGQQPTFGSRVGRPWIHSPIPPFEATPGKPGIYPPYDPTPNKSANDDDANKPTPLIITFPSEDESRGTISLAWRGPPYSSTYPTDNNTNDTTTDPLSDPRFEWLGLSLLWTYLTDSAASPLQKAFVENSRPICADLGPAHEVFTEGYHQIWFQECDVERIGEVVDLFRGVIARQSGLISGVSGIGSGGSGKDGGSEEGEEEKEEFDLARMRTVIRRERRRLLESSERRPTRAIVDGIVRNFIYGPRAGEPIDGSGTNGNVVTPQDEMAALHADVDVLPLLDRAESLCDPTNDDSKRHWQSLLQKYILSRPMAVVHGLPSAAKSKQISSDEKEREARQAASLGEEGLALLQTRLEEAMKANEDPIPQEVLTSLPVPDLEKVPSIPLFTVRVSPSVHSESLAVIQDSVRDVPLSDAEEMVQLLKRDALSEATPTAVAAPFHADLTHIESNFVFAAVGIDTSPLTPHQRLYLPLLSEIFFKLPCTLEDGTERWTKEEFVNRLHDETVSFSSGVGLLGGSIPQMYYVSVQVENDGGKGPGNEGAGLKTALTWIGRALYQTIITPEAIRTAVQRLVSEIPPQVRHGPSVVATVAAELMYDGERANAIACDLFRQREFLMGVVGKMGMMSMVGEDEEGEEGDEPEGGGDEKDGKEEEAVTAAAEEKDDSVKEADDKAGAEAIQDMVKELEGIRNSLFQTSNMHAFVAANLKTIPNLLDTLVTSLSRKDAATTPATGRLIENVSAFSVLKSSSTESTASAASTATGGEGAICALSAIESGFLTIISPGLEPYHPHRAALLVAIEYLTALEGDFWVKLRGAGLTYHYSISDSTDSRLIKFGLFKCTDVPAAFERASEIMVAYASGKVKMEGIGLENAKASLAFQIISGRSSKLSAATSSFVRIFKGEKMDYDKHLLSRIAEVTADDAMHALITHLVPIFDPSSKLAIACPTNKLDAIYDYFFQRGWRNLKKVPEEKLFSTFDGSGDGDGGEEKGKEEAAQLPEKVPGMSMFLPGAFAAQFKCSCPKCDR